MHGFALTVVTDARDASDAREGEMLKATKGSSSSGEGMGFGCWHIRQ